MVLLTRSARWLRFSLLKSAFPVSKSSIIAVDAASAAAAAAAAWPFFRTTAAASFILVKIDIFEMLFNLDIYD